MARVSMNVLDVVAWVSSTGRVVEGGRVANVYLEGDVLVLKVRLGGSDELLVIEPGRRIHLSRRVKTPSEYKPLPLVVLARKHCRGSRITSIAQAGFDRIVEVVFSSGYKIVAEIVPRGFTVLVSPEGLILAATRYEKLRDREVRPRIPYRYPPLNTLNSFILGGDEIKSRLGDCKSIVRSMVRSLGVPGEAAEEALYRSGIGLDTPCSELGNSDFESISEALKEIYGESLAGKGFLALDEGNPLEADPFRPLKFSERGISVVELESLDEALDELFSRQIVETAGRPDAELERIRESYKRIEETVSWYKAKAEELRRAAERAASMYEALESLIECFEAARGHGLDPSRECEGILAYEPERARFLVEVGGTRFWVVSGESPDKVIVRLYREAGEAEAKARRAARAKEELLDKLRAAELKAAARRIQEKARGRKRWWFERYHWTITRGGLIAIGGRDAGQNESIVRRYLEDRDVFLHAEIHGGSAVVLKTGGREPSPGDLEDAAVLAVAYSKAWKSGLGSLQAYWVLGSQVSKSPPSGEYLARGAFMVYGRKNYLKPIQLRLSIGIALATDGAPVVFVGSREASEAYTIGYAVIAPGDSRVEECAADIKKGLVEAFPEELKPLAMAVDETEIASRLPGRCTLLRVATRRGGPPGRLPVVS